ncbi:hypothetical protein BC938DRAFT_480476 [Jimgerdemannia flammicorona]|uniref:Uncharacterized protein n=1 Tax=Jimgerdemannia flammicorona TaxID=994334 RepID=A0A433QIC9_9FUNG|nr:hypothetical protein BC938DRAFT_480476 [Jimgerdemannia flammicorona]
MNSMVLDSAVHQSSATTMALDQNLNIDEDLWIPEEDNDVELNDTELNDIELQDLDTDIMEPVSLADIDEELAYEIEKDEPPPDNNHILPLSTPQVSNFISQPAATTAAHFSPITTSVGTLNGTGFEPLSPSKSFSFTPITAGEAVHTEAIQLISAPPQEQLAITTTDSTGVDLVPQSAVTSTITTATATATAPDMAVQSTTTIITTTTTVAPPESSDLPVIPIPDDQPAGIAGEATESTIDTGRKEEKKLQAGGDESAAAAAADAPTGNEEEEIEPVPVPPVLVFYNDEVFPLFDYDPADDPNATNFKEPLLLGADDLYYGPLGEFMDALRYEFLDPEDDAKEVVVEFPELNLEIAQDSIETRSTTLDELDQLYNSLLQMGHIEPSDGPLKIILKERVKFSSQLKRLTALLEEGGAIDNPIILEDTDSRAAAYDVEADGDGGSELIVLRDSPEPPEGRKEVEKGRSAKLDASRVPANFSSHFPDSNARRDSYNSQLSGDDGDLVAYEDEFGEDPEDETGHSEVAVSPSMTSKRKSFGDDDGEDQGYNDEEGGAKGAEEETHKKLRSA